MKNRRLKSRGGAERNAGRERDDQNNTKERQKNMGASQNTVARHSQNFLAALSLHFRLMIYSFLLIEKALCKFVSGLSNISYLISALILSKFLSLSGCFWVLLAC